jgi:site-specific recombinase XerD
MTSWRKTLDRLEKAYSSHTLRSYRSGFGVFSAWCRKRRVVPLPCEPATLVAYIDQESSRLRPATLKNRLCAIRKVHRLSEYGDPTAHPDVELAMRRARRAQPSRQKQALGVTASLRDILLVNCSDDLIGLRDKVLVSVGFDVLCRRGELAALAIEDLTRRNSGRYQVLVRRAKNDPEGAGRTANLSTMSSKLVEQWLEAIGSRSGPLLRPVYGQRALALYLEPFTVGRVLKKLANRARNDALPSGRISGHSLRVGAAQQLTLDGHDILQIMRVGGWRSMSVVARYVENVDIDVWT